MPIPEADAPDFSLFSIEITLNIIYMLIKQFPDELNKILFNSYKLSLQAKKTQSH